MNRELITTADGSHSLYVKELDEHYHSIHGAIQEAQHVFIKTGIQHLVSQNYSTISILEIGFGTGLNTLLSFLEAEKLNVKLDYTSLEAFPLDTEIVSRLNYVELISKIDSGISSVHTSTPLSVTEQSDISNHENKIKNIFQQLHSCEWEKKTELSKNFSLLKIKNTLQEIKFSSNFDLIFFDAFGPRVQPEMWTEEVFSKIYASTNPKGCLVTYCAKGEVKRTLKKVGYIVETLPGPPRKREMVRAMKYSPIQ